MGKFVTAASMEHMLIRKTSNRMPRSKNPVFGEWSFDKQVEMQERMRNRRLRVKKIREERKKNEGI
jgi:hypothetical protein